MGTGLDMSGIKCNRCGRFLDADNPYIELAGTIPCRWCLGCFDEIYNQIQQCAQGLRILATAMPGLKKWEKM